MIVTVLDQGTEAGVLGLRALMASGISKKPGFQHDFSNIEGQKLDECVLTLEHCSAYCVISYAHLLLCTGQDHAQCSVWVVLLIWTSWDLQMPFQKSKASDFLEWQWLCGGYSCWHKLNFYGLWDGFVRWNRDLWIQDMQGIYSKSAGSDYRRWEESASFSNS